MDPLNLTGKTVLVTGGNGFLGRHLIKSLLDTEAKVISMDRIAPEHDLKVPCHQIDLSHEAALKACIAAVQPDLVYHLAASLNRTRDFSETNSILETNLNGTVNLLNALKDLPYQKLIYVSTSDVYGGHLIQPPFKETGQFVPASPYALSKYCGELAVQTYSELYSKQYTILRLFNFFGPGMSSNFFISQLVEKLKSHTDFEMTEGAQQRDFLYISDVVQALLLAQDTEADQQVFNVCSGIGTPIKDIALAVKALLNSKTQIRFGALPYRGNEVWNMTGDPSKIAEVLGWRPTVSFQEGLEAYLKHVN